MVITWPWTVCSTLVKIYLFSAVNVQPWHPHPPTQYRTDGKSVMLRKSQWFFFLFCSFLLPGMALCFFFTRAFFFFLRCVNSGFSPNSSVKSAGRARDGVHLCPVGRKAPRLSNPSQLLFFPAEGLWKDQTWLMRWIWLPLLAPHHQLKYLCNQTNLNVKQVRSLSSHSCSHTSFVPPFL